MADTGIGVPGKSWEERVKEGLDLLTPRRPVNYTDRRGLRYIDLDEDGLPVLYPRRKVVGNATYFVVDNSDGTYTHTWQFDADIPIID